VIDGPWSNRDMVNRDTSKLILAKNYTCIVSSTHNGKNISNVNKYLYLVYTYKLI